MSDIDELEYRLTEYSDNNLNYVLSLSDKSIFESLDMFNVKIDNFDDNFVYVSFEDRNKIIDGTETRKLDFNCKVKYPLFLLKPFQDALENNHN